MSEVMNACVIMHNMIIEDERENPMHDPLLFDFEGPLADVDHEVPADWTDYITTQMEIRDEGIHQLLQNDLLEHLWVHKGLAAN